ncbi:FKBP-type peptidyl-prolyl cis-trans isomerase [Terasakiella sp. A23]|uniref:FKBP-type peptidyl-prolyl cis-trans isomerase n=1 Tax=Terasakiella sp. FCG-A23 TaxID=3080561 RepID=UPI0029554EEA|nr:FKBP-type peptidyl-prolyl cis-trans isomerase [Terasakiella sp. A23]MDV7339720.1 FKBP-type peptidyl-prolyl cis-trans isomerase [Terasakiella sp. A23]
MSNLTAGQKVKIEVTFTMNDGTVVPASPPGEPLEMVVGEPCGFKPIDDTLPGMSVGETVTKKLQPEEAFGMPNADLVMEIERSMIETSEEIQVGMSMQMQTPEGQNMMAMIHEVTETTVTVDANHPLAGEELDFKIEVLEVA